MTVQQDVGRLLSDGAKQIGIVLSENHIEAFQIYLKLLKQWNRSFNLTALTDEETIVIRHFLDSLMLVDHLQGSEVADVGSGAGFPGVPLAIVNPEVQFSLLDSNGKRCRFLTQLKIELGCNNLSIHHIRAEAFTERRFDQIVVRAYGSLENIVRDMEHMLVETGSILAMKGNIDQLELATPYADNWHFTAQKLLVPFLDEKRHLIKLRRK